MIPYNLDSASQKDSAEKSRINTPLQLQFERFRQTYLVNLEHVETIHSYTVPQDWIPSRTDIRPRKEAKSVAELAWGTSLTYIYTDGSGINGKFGAAA